MASNPKTTNGTDAAKKKRNHSTRSTKDTLILYKKDANGDPEIVEVTTNADVILTKMGLDPDLKLYRKKANPKAAPAQNAVAGQEDATS